MIPQGMGMGFPMDPRHMVAMGYWPHFASPGFVGPMTGRPQEAVIHYLPAHGQGSGSGGHAKAGQRALPDTEPAAPAHHLGPQPEPATQKIPQLALPAPQPEKIPVQETAANDGKDLAKVSQVASAGFDQLSKPEEIAKPEVPVTTADQKEEAPEIAKSEPERQSQRQQKPLSIAQANARLQDALQKRSGAVAKGGKPSSNLKRPASNVEVSQNPKPMKRPSASGSALVGVAKQKTSTQMKKPAASKNGQKGTPEVVYQIPPGKNRPIPGKASRVRTMPFGCNKCRGVAGCTPSCWVLKGWVRV
jgi:hypothetical protein